MRSTVIHSTVVHVFLGCTVLVACDDAPADSGEGAIGPAESAAATSSDPAAPDPAAPGPAAPDPASGLRGSEAEPTAPTAASNEACARVVVVAWKGAAYAADDVTRSKGEAHARAGALRRRVADAGEDFAALARAESDASSSGPRGGLIGTYARDGWPEAHAVLADAVFDLEVGQVSDVVEAPYGYVFAKRCPVEKVHTRHILVRYRGAKNAGDEVTRSKEEARAVARTLWARAAADGSDFAAVAREHSEDASAERGGDLGPVGRGLLAPSYEEAAFALAPGAVSPVVESAYGFHVIERVR